MNSSRRWSAPRDRPSVSAHRHCVTKATSITGVAYLTIRNATRLHKIACECFDVVSIRPMAVPPGSSIRSEHHSRDREKAARRGETRRSSRLVAEIQIMADLDVSNVMRIAREIEGGEQ